MIQELQKSEWRNFFNGLSRDLMDWETMVHVLNPGLGAQILSEGLSFNNLTFDQARGREIIKLFIGSGTANRQTHSIAKPTKVAFTGRGRGPAGTLDIEDASGTTTLITFIQPKRRPVEYV